MFALEKPAASMCWFSDVSGSKAQPVAVRCSLFCGSESSHNLVTEHRCSTSHHTDGNFYKQIFTSISGQCRKGLLPMISWSFVGWKIRLFDGIQDVNYGRLWNLQVRRLYGATNVPPPGGTLKTDCHLVSDSVLCTGKSTGRVCIT